MTILSPNILPPPGPQPDFQALAREAAAQRVENKWLEVPAQTFVIGFDDPESDDGPDRFFAWDNEREPYEVSVHGFWAQARPTSNGEYARYLLQTGDKSVPVTWTVEDAYANGYGRADGSEGLPASGQIEELTDGDEAFVRFIRDKYVRTVYGKCPLRYALDWPLMSSYNEIEGYARWSGARIATLHEVRSIHEFVERGKNKERPR